MKVIHSIIICSCFILVSCQPPPSYSHENDTNVLDIPQKVDKDLELDFNQLVYVPIYSDIYSETKNVKFDLTATLSIRNTSLTDSLYIGKIDYYDSDGQLVRQYLDHTFRLSPMQSIEYVIEEDDNVGGTGANFMVEWGAKSKDLTPVFQGVMISTHGQQGISFLTEGIPVR